MNALLHPRPASVVRTLPEGAKRVMPIPQGTPWPDLSDQTSLMAQYAYYHADGAPAVLIARYEGADPKNPGKIRKTLMPHTYWKLPDGSFGWACKGMEGVCPLYNLPDLLARPDAPVLISEGEKCADAVAGAFVTYVSVTWSGGTNALGKTDFAPLKGREIVILPDHDAPGAAAAAALVVIMVELGAKRVRVLDIAAVGELVSKEVPQGYDIHDAIRDGLTSARLGALLRDHPELMAEHSTGASDAPEGDTVVAHLTKTLGHAPLLPPGYSVSEAGVFKHGTDARGMPTAVFASSPMVVVGRTFLGEGRKGYGHLILFQTPHGSWETVVIPSRLLAGDCREMREILMDAGVVCAVETPGKQALNGYIMYAAPETFVEIAAHPGWYDDCFVLPQSIIVPSHFDKTMQLDMQGRAHLLAQAGTLEEWCALAGLVEHCSRAAFVLSLSFAAVLARLVGEPGGGFHLYGNSSRGKTTLLMLAGSVWGGGGRAGFVRSWLATGNGIEGIAVDHSDILLPLDEMMLSPPEITADLTYMMANGIGKARATKTGSAQASAQWHGMVLSSGEDTSAAHLRAAGRGMGRRRTGGLAVRMPDIPVEPEPGQSFEELGAFGSEGEMAEYIGQTACAVYGHAGPELVRQLMMDKEQHLKAVKEIMDVFMKIVTKPGDDPQVGRVAKRFALVAAAGTLATRFRILPWQPKSALYATLACYAAWECERGTNGSEEDREALLALREFFELHGSSRFEPVRPEDHSSDDPMMTGENDRTVRDRCGYRTTDAEGHTIYYILPEAFRSQICAAHSPDVMLGVARARGALLGADGARMQKKVRLPEYPDGKRVYALRLDKLS